MLQTPNLDGIPMNIYEENSARNFRVQSERKWTLIFCETLLKNQRVNRIFLKEMNYKTMCVQLLHQ